MLNVFLTGFPGFIGKYLVKVLLKKNPSIKFFLLVHPTMLMQSQEDFKSLKLDPKIHEIIPGDITQPNLSMPSDISDRVQHATHMVFHLAAIYNLMVPEKLAKRVNVQGTENMLNFFSQSPSLKRFNHISTCYVSGDQKGIITPDKLEENQHFHNFYESTKYESEVLVKQRIREMPITIFRPAIVVGDSKTGETDKFDGPYVVMKFLHRIKPLLRLVPNLGFKHAQVNTVPVDYAACVMAHLAFEEKAKGQTYQICDQNPPTTEEFFEFLVHMIGGIKPYRFEFLKKLILKILRFPQAAKITGISPQHLDYFLHEGQYRSANLSKDLQGSGIKLSNYKEFYPALYAFMKDRLSSPSS